LILTAVLEPRVITCLDFWKVNSSTYFPAIDVEIYGWEMLKSKDLALNGSLSLRMVFFIYGITSISHLPGRRSLLVYQLPSHPPTLFESSPLPLQANKAALAYFFWKSMSGEQR
jgi:hypothetical protein